MADKAVAGKLVWDVSLNATKFTKDVSDSKGAMQNLASFATSLVGSFNPLGFAMSALSMGAKLMFGGVKMLVGGFASLASMALKAAFAMTKFLAGAIWGVIKAAARAVTVVGGMLTAALAGAGGFSLYKAMNMASEAGDAAARFVLVFGQAATDTEARVRQLSTALGRSRFELRDLVATLGLTITGMGVGQKEASGMSTALVEMAANLAEIAGGKIEETMEALRAAFTGQTRALKNYGIAIDETDIVNRAMAMGLAKTKDEITDTVRAQALYAMLVEKTGRMQGAAAGGVADYDGQLEKLKGSIRDLVTEIGQRLLPKAAAFLQWVNSTAVPFVRGLVDKFFTDWGPRMGEWLGNVVGEVAKWMRVAWDIVTKTWTLIGTWVKDVLKGWGIDTESFGSGFTGVIATIVTFVQSAFEKARRFAANFQLYIDYWVAEIKAKFSSLVEDIRHLFSWEYLGTYFKHFFRQLMGLFGAWIEDAINANIIFAKKMVKILDPRNQIDLLLGQNPFARLMDEAIEEMSRTSTKMDGFQFESSPQAPKRKQTAEEQALRERADALRKVLDEALNAPLPPGLDDETMKNIKDKVKDFFKNAFTFTNLPGLPDFKMPDAGASNNKQQVETRKSSFTVMADAWKKVQEQIVLRSREQKRDSAINSTAKSASEMVSLLREIREIQKGTREKISTWADEMIRDNMNGVLVE